MSRLSRRTISLAVAYAIVLSGLLGASAGHAFDPAAELCLTQRANAEEGPPHPDRPQQHGMPECCPALCGSLSVILPPAVVPERTAWFLPARWTPPAPHLAQSANTPNRSARAPPLG